MDIRSAALKVKEKLDFLKATQGKVLFNEWVLVQIKDNKWKVLLYQTPRKEDLKAHFKDDISSLKLLKPLDSQIGEFGFSDTGHGTHFDAYIHAGEDVFFLLNNTSKPASEITNDSSWEKAQAEFEELQEIFILDPVEVT